MTTYDLQNHKSSEFDTLPDLLESQTYPLEPYVPVSMQDDDDKTTQSDLNILNNHLAMCSAALPQIRTMASLCALSATVCKLIEVRRKVKKLPWGVEPQKGGRVFEIME